MTKAIKETARPPLAPVLPLLAAVLLFILGPSLFTDSMGVPTVEAASPPAATERLMRKGPYLLYHNKNTTMTLLWQTFETPLKAKVEWGPSPSLGHGPVTVVEHSSVVDGHQFAYTIGGLTPGTRYFWRVTVNEESYTGSFLAPPEASSPSVSFYGYGNGVPDKEERDHLMKALLEDMGTDPDHRQTMILHTGNYVTDGLTEDSWDGFFDPASISAAKSLAGLPLIGALGSREGHSRPAGDSRLLRQNMGQYFRKYFPYPMYKLANRYFYSFDYGPVHVAVLDTWTYPGNTGDGIPDARQREWLKDDLKVSKKPWKVVLIHTPLRDCSFESRELQDVLLPIIESPATDVRLVLQGRQSYYSHVQKTNGAYGITYLTLGGGSVPSSGAVSCSAPFAPFLVKAEAGRHFVRFDVSGTTMTVRVMKSDGSVIETFSLNKEIVKQVK
ncbi:MAG TPA: metallophosphoesterase family protein [Syntrophorhabdaceae bacterium]